MIFGQIDGGSRKPLIYKGYVNRIGFQIYAQPILKSFCYKCKVKNRK